MPKFVPVIRVSLVVLGALLVVGAFVGVLTLGISTNPPPLRIAVAARDIIQGEALGPADYRIVEQILDPRLAQLYVQEADLPRIDGAVVAETIRRGDPLNKVKLVTIDNPAALHRYSLALANADDVVMTLPVNPDIIPARVAPGDYVNVLFAGGADVGTNRLPEPTPIPVLSAAIPVTGVEELPQLEGVEVVGGLPSADAEPDIALPLADVMLERVLVLDVQYQQTSNTAYSASSASDSARSTDSTGPITAIVVRVPRSHQTLLAFGASVSKLRFSIASPLVGADPPRPQMGVDWRKYVELYRWKESQVAARGETLTGTLYPDLEAVAPPLDVPAER